MTPEFCESVDEDLYVEHHQPHSQQSLDRASDETQHDGAKQGCGGASSSPCPQEIGRAL